MKNVLSQYQKHQKNVACLRYISTIFLFVIVFLSFFNLSRAAPISNVADNVISTNMLNLTIESKRWIMAPAVKPQANPNANITLEWKYISEKIAPSNLNGPLLYSVDPIRTFSFETYEQLSTSWSFEKGTKYYSQSNPAVEYITSSYKVEQADLRFIIETYKNSDIISFEEHVPGLIFPTNNETMKFNIEVRNWNHSAEAVSGQSRWIAFGILWKSSEPMDIDFNSMKLNTLGSGKCTNPNDPDFGEGPINQASFSLDTFPGSNITLRFFDLAELDGVFGCSGTRSAFLSENLTAQWIESGRKEFLIEFYFRALHNITYDPDFSILFGVPSGEPVYEPPPTKGLNPNVVAPESTVVTPPTGANTLAIGVSIGVAAVVIIVAIIVVLKVEPVRSRLGLVTWDSPSKKIDARMNLENDMRTTTTTTNAETKPATTTTQSSSPDSSQWRKSTKPELK